MIRGAVIDSVLYFFLSMSGKNGGRKNNEITDETISIVKIEIPELFIPGVMSVIKKSGITAMSVVAVDADAALKVKFTFLKNIFLETELFRISNITRAVSAISPVESEIPERICSLIETFIIESSPAVHKIAEHIITERIKESFIDL